MPGNDEVWVFDSSCLIRSKTEIAIGRQWQVFKALEDMVVAGVIAMPRQVIKEVAEIAHPDLPGAWAPGMRQQLQHPVQASWVNVQRVMSAAGALVDPNDSSDVADPYVVALALDLVDAGLQPCCVTDDHIDRPPRISLVTACGLLAVNSCSLGEFLARTGLDA